MKKIRRNSLVWVASPRNPGIIPGRTTF
jgi:hypothetical protein